MLKPTAPSTPTLLLHAAWLAILLGLIIQGLVLLTGAASGDGLLAELAGKVAWSTIVCGGVALGMAAGKLQPAAMGLLGSFFAPAAFWTARTVQKSLGSAMSAAGAAAGLSAAGIALVKSVEYAALGALIGWISQQPWGNLKAHAGVGLFIGAAAAGVIWWLNAAAGRSITGAALAPFIINEVLFPAGCAVVLYVSRTLATRLKPKT